MNMIIREGKAMEVVLATVLTDPIIVRDVNVRLYDDGILELKGSTEDPYLDYTAHITNCEIMWDCTLKVTPSPSGSVTPFRKK